MSENSPAGATRLAPARAEEPGTDAEPQGQAASGGEEPPKRSRGKARLGDRIFSGLTGGASLLVFAVIILIAVFLISKALPSLHKDSSNFLTERQFLTDQSPPVFGIAALVFGTVLTSFLALVMAVPVALGVSLYVTEYAPPRVARPLGYLVDLLAAVPSVIYGLWGIDFLLGHSLGFQTFLQKHLSWIPIFSNDVGAVGRSILLASVVLAVRRRWCCRPSPAGSGRRCRHRAGVVRDHTCRQHGGTGGHLPQQQARDERRRMSHGQARWPRRWLSRAPPGSPMVVSSAARRSASSPSPHCCWRCCCSP